MKLRNDVVGQRGVGEAEENAAYRNSPTLSLFLCGSSSGSDVMFTAEIWEIVKSWAYASAELLQFERHQSMFFKLVRLEYT